MKPVNHPAIEYKFSSIGSYIPNSNISFGDTDNLDTFLPKFISKPLFITVSLNVDGAVEKKEFDTFDEFIKFRFNNELTYRFIEYVNDRNEVVFYNVLIDKLNKQIAFFRDYRDVATGWHIYFNTKDNIVIHDKFFTTLTNHRYLKNYNLFKDIDFYVGISVLIFVISNTEKLFFQDVLPILRNQVSHFANIYNQANPSSGKKS